MELKSLILGLVLSAAAFAVKSGGGLAYLFLQSPGKRFKFLAVTAFLTGYGLVFLFAAGVLTRVNFIARIDLLQEFFKSGMTLHFLLAFLLVVWGVRLLMKGNAGGTTRGWLLLVVPCPVCFFVILLSCGFVGALYPASPLVFLCLYAGFCLLSLAAAFFFSLAVKDRGAAGPFLGALMLYIALYFLVSVLVVPQFADLDKIYRIALPDHSSDASGSSLYFTLLVLTCLAAGFLRPHQKKG